jgi:hypothetical protein
MVSPFFRSAWECPSHTPGRDSSCYQNDVSHYLRGLAAISIMGCGILVL